MSQNSTQGLSAPPFSLSGGLAWAATGMESLHASRGRQSATVALQVHMDLKSKNVLLNHDKTLAKIADVSDLCTWALPSCCTALYAQLDVCGKQQPSTCIVVSVEAWHIMASSPAHEELSLCGSCAVSASRLLQVGLSRLINSSSHQQSSFQLGTFEYTAPELLTGKRCNEKVCLKPHEHIAMSTVSHAAGCSSRKVCSPSPHVIWFC